MTSEMIIQAYWEIQEYWIKPRFAFQTKSGSWSDIDILSYNPEKKHLVISESKIQGPKKDVFVYNRYSQAKYGGLFDYDKKDDNRQNYLSFLDNIPLICKNGIIFKNFKSSVSLISIQLVSNYYITQEVYPDVIDEINKYMKHKLLGLKEEG